MVGFGVLEVVPKQSARVSSAPTRLSAFGYAITGGASAERV